MPAVGVSALPSGRQPQQRSERVAALEKSSSAGKEHQMREGAV